MGIENVGSTTLIDVKEVFTGLDISYEVRAIGQPEDIGVHKIHCCGKIELMDFDRRLRSRENLKERQIAVKDEGLRDVMEFWGRLELRLGVAVGDKPTLGGMGFAGFHREHIRDAIWDQSAFVPH